MRTPDRAVWPLPPRPEVLPLPEPMPRPTRMRFLREPALSAISLSFIALLLVSCLLVDDADEMLDLADHAANLRRVLKLGNPADLVELEADQRRALRVVAADRAAGLLDLDRLCGLGHRLQLRNAQNARSVYSATASASPPARRDCRVATVII